MRGDGGPADLKKTQGQGREHVCDTGMPVRNGNPGTDRPTTTKVASVRKQLGTKNSKSNEGIGETGASCYRGRLLQEHFMQNYYIDGEITDSSFILIHEGNH